MSEIMLNVCDSARSLHATVHASRVDYLVGALSADPETIEELQTAVTRFLPPGELVFDGWAAGIRDEPWDAGVAIIDLAARLVVVQSTYSQPGPKGAVGMIDDKGREVGVRYHVAEDWLFRYHMEDWQPLSDERRRLRAAAPRPVDARAVLYGEVCQFIAWTSWDRCAELAPAAEIFVRDPSERDTAEAHESQRHKVRKAIVDIHASWLTTPRADLNGLAPRDVLLAQKDHIGWDMQDRCEQWSATGIRPVGLAPDSTACRCGGFDTHEIVQYYELVRFLLWDCWEHWAGQANRHDLAEEIRRLEAARDEWLQTPDPELHGRTPASVIARERARLPEAVSAAEAIIDHDCPMCQMMAELPGPTFWHLDGCNMDPEFAFSFHRTLAEWEDEQREYEEFSRRCDEKWQARQATDQEESDSPWRTSYFDSEAAGTPTFILFGLGAHLAELTQNLKDALAGQETIDQLNRIFGNLREAVHGPAAALVEPVASKMSDALADVAEAFPELARKCADFERRLTSLVRRTNEPILDEEMPF